MLSLEFDDLIDLINYVIDDKAEENIYNRWLIGYQTMYSLSEFKQKLNFTKPSEREAINKIEVDDVLNDLYKNFG